MFIYSFFKIFLLFYGTNVPASSPIIEIESLMDEKPIAINIIPKPSEVEARVGTFNINSSTTFVIPAGADEEFQYATNFLNGKIERATGFKLATSTNFSKENTILVEITPEIKNPEGYILEVKREGIVVKAQTPAGVFYAFQSIRQMMPVSIENAEKQAFVKSISVPCSRISDEPRFAWRGLHLDVCRHYFDINFIKKYIDLMAMHKLNRFHWHLTEDQGWRIEIKKYPKLTQISSQRKETLVGSAMNKVEKFDGKAYGGFYTQAQIKEVVKYAKERFVTVVPEIEMPGHALAALAAYPEFSCNQKPLEVGTKWGVFDDVYCPREETFQFLEDVLNETMELFPSEYIHIGGDECPKTRWKTCSHCQQVMKDNHLKDEHELQSYFIRRMEKVINAKGRKLIGWDEILEGGLSDNATVMSWRGTDGGIAAAKQHHNAIMSPGTHCYFDHYQSKNREREPLAIGGFTDVEKVYSYEPIPKGLTTDEASFILGAQGNVWTEYITSSAQVEYMAFPRAIALAEVVWSNPEKKNYTDFLARLNIEKQRLDLLKVNYAKHIFDKK